MYKRQVEHIRGLKALGAVVNVEHGIVTASVPGSKKRLTGAQIVLDCPSVGATETILMAAVLADGGLHHRKRCSGT